MEYGIDWEAPPHHANDSVASTEIVMPEIKNPITQESYDLLLRSIDPCKESTSFGRDVFIATIEFLERLSK